MNSPDNYLTPEELIERYPHTHVIGWTASKIGIFYSAGLLHGHRGKERRVLILESSFKKLLRYANEVSKERLINLDDE